MHVQLSPLDPQFLRIALHLTNLLSSFLPWITREKTHQEFVRRNPAPLGERTHRNHLSHFRRSAQNHIGAKPKLLLNPILDSLCEPRDVPLVGPENHIAALHVGLR